MKTILALITAVCLSVSLQAQTTSTFVLDTDSLAAKTTNSTASAALVVGANTLVDVQVTFNGTNSSLSEKIGDNGQITLRMKGTMDGDTYLSPNTDTNYVLSAATSGSNNVAWYRTIDTSSFNALKVTSMENTSTNCRAAQLTVKIFTK